MSRFQLHLVMSVYLPFMIVSLILPWEPPRLPGTRVDPAQIWEALVVGAAVVAMELVDAGETLVAVFIGAYVAWSELGAV